MITSKQAFSLATRRTKLDERNLIDRLNLGVCLATELGYFQFCSTDFVNTNLLAILDELKTRKKVKRIFEKLGYEINIYCHHKWIIEIFWDKET